MRIVFEKQQLVIFGAAAALLTGFVFCGYAPLQKKLDQVCQVKADQEVLIATAAEQKTQLPLLEEQLDELQGMIANYELNIPQQRDLGGFLQQIADLIDKHDLTEQVVQPGSETQADGLKCIPITIQCKGSLSRIFDFYRELQELDRMVRIENVKLVNKKDYSGEVSMQTKAVVYYRPQVDRG